MSGCSRMRVLFLFLLFGLSLALGWRASVSWAESPPQKTLTLATVQLPPDHYVLRNRQKFIGLTGYFPGVEYDAITFLIIRQPINGRLYGTPPNLYYVPNNGFVGTDSFVYQTMYGASSIRRTVTLSVQSAFVPTMAVPSPTFGINESHWMYAGQMFNYSGRLGPYKDAGNGPYTHCVDFNIGSDANNPFGTAANPRRSVPANLPAGSVVELHGSNINSQTRFIISGNGTPGQPIFVRGVSATQKPIFRRPMSVESNYIVFENLEFDCQDFGSGTVGGNWFWITNTETAPFRTFHHVCLRHALIHDQPTMDPGQNPSGFVAGIRHFDPALNNASLLVSDHVVYDVEIRNFGVWNDFSGTEDHSGCLFTANSQSCWVLDCHLHHLRGPGISPSRTGADTQQAPANNIYAARNYIHNCKETAISFKNATNCIFAKNVCHTFRKSNSSAGYAVVIIDDDPTAQWPGSDNIWVLFNTIYDSENGILHELRNTNSLAPDKHSRSYLVGNILFDIRLIRGSPNVDGVAIHKSQLGESRIVGNTIYKCDHGIWAGLGALVDPAHTTQVVRNNLIVDLTERFLATNGMHGMHIFVTPTSILPYTTIDHNMHFESVGQERFTIAHVGQTNFNYYTIGDLYSGTGFGSRSIDSNPLLSDPANLDFRPIAGTAAGDNGASDDAYNTFAKKFGLSINYYLDGTPRPTNYCTIGALPVTSGVQPGV